MSSLHFVVHPLPGTDDQLNDRLKEVSDKINRFGYVTPNALGNLKVAVKQCVVGPSHFALLLEDGRICRVAFSIISDRLDLSKNDASKSNGGSGGGGSGGAGGSKGSGGGGGGNGSGGSGGRQLTRTRARIMRTNAIRGGRGSAGVIMSSRPIVPAPYVPEELVTQAQVVLQGKSRNLIIRELQ
ncbi:hypothetical protein J437_LFUL008200, partial [Ladona fulva]